MFKNNNNYTKVKICLLGLPQSGKTFILNNLLFYNDILPDNQPTLYPLTVVHSKSVLLEKYNENDFIQSYELADDIRDELSTKREYNQLDNIHYVLYAAFKTGFENFIITDLPGIHLNSEGGNGLIIDYLDYTSTKDRSSIFSLDYGILVIKDYKDMDKAMIHHYKCIEEDWNLDIGYIINYRSKHFDEMVNNAADEYDVILTRSQKSQLKVLYEEKLESIRSKYCQLLNSYVHIYTGEFVLPDMLKINQ